MTTLRRFSTIALAFLLTLAAALPVSAGSIINSVSPILSQDCTTANRLARITTASTSAAVLGCSLLSDDGTNVTLASGALILPAGVAAAPAIVFGSGEGLVWDPVANDIYVVQGGANEAGLGGSGLQLSSDHVVGWYSGVNLGGGLDLIIARDAANTLAQRNGTNAQTFRGYGTYTDASNYERWALSAIAGGGITLAAETAGTGADDLNITLTPAGTGGVHISRADQTGITFLRTADSALVGRIVVVGDQLQLAGNGILPQWELGSNGIRALTDNTYDIGAPTATRPRSIYLAAPALASGSGTGLTVNVSSEPRRVVHKVTVTYAAFAAAGLTADKTIATLPAKTRLVGVVAETTTPYTGGGVTAATLIVGKSVGGNEYVVSHDVFSAAIVKGNADADLGTAINRANATQGGDLPSWSGTTAVSVRLTTTAANTDQLTAGSTTYYLTTEVMP